MSSRNTYRSNTNRVPVRALSPWLVIALFSLIGGLTWVYGQNQMYARGNEIKSLETQLKEVANQNDVMRSKIAILSSRTALKRKLADGAIKMVPITQDRIVQITFPKPAESRNEIRMVSNQRVNR